MSKVQIMVLDDIRKSLAKTIQSRAHESLLNEAFSLWLLGDEFVPEERSLIGRLTESKRTSSESAALGLLAKTQTLNENERSLLKDDLSNLLGRDPVIAGTPMPYCMDGLSIGGILLGAKSLQDQGMNSQVESWLESCRNVTANGRGLGTWQESMVNCIAKDSGYMWPIVGDSAQRNSVATVAMGSVGIRKTDDLDAVELAEQNALNQIRSTKTAELDWGEAVLQLAALNWIKRSRPITDLRNISVVELCELLRRASDALQFWTWENKPRTKTAQIRKWHIDHEYQVQNFLWAMLSPIFPDLIQEEYLIKLGTKQPRADLGIPSLRVIVEAKFWYTKHKSKKMIEEIAQDTGLYLVPESKYCSIVPFIWDEGRRTEEHKGLIAALKKMDGISDAIIISKPGHMK